MALRHHASYSIIFDSHAITNLRHRLPDDFKGKIEAWDWKAGLFHHLSCTLIDWMLNTSLLDTPTLVALDNRDILTTPWTFNYAAQSWLWCHRGCSTLLNRMLLFLTASSKVVHATRNLIHLWYLRIYHNTDIYLYTSEIILSHGIWERSWIPLSTKSTISKGARG